MLALGASKVTLTCLIESRSHMVSRRKAKMATDRERGGAKLGAVGCWWWGGWSTCHGQRREEIQLKHTNFVPTTSIGRWADLGRCSGRFSPGLGLRSRLTALEAQPTQRRRSACPNLPAQFANAHKPCRLVVTDIQPTDADCWVIPPPQQSTYYRLSFARSLPSKADRSICSLGRWPNASFETLSVHISHRESP